MGSKSEEEFSNIQVCQFISFYISIISISCIVSGLLGMPIFNSVGIPYWMLFGMIFITIGLQLYAIRKFGFRKSFTFLNIPSDTSGSRWWRRGGGRG
jgi:uncharacterized membrane protein (DUF485 family)